MTNLKIFESIRNSEYSKLAIFLRYNYNFKIKTEPNGDNILMVALDIVDTKKRFRMFEYLLDKQLVDLNETNNQDRNIFFVAVIRNCENELNLLLERYFGDIDWTQMDKEGKTILHHAAGSKNYNILENLLVYCNKYRINVDIPDGFTKITPYLLANRLNNYRAADLLVKIGKASKQQMDEKVFYDAERWKQEGQLEAYKRYLKTKQSEMTQAKVNGNIKLYKFLNQLNAKLDKEINKNPNLLPLVANLIIENDTQNSIESNSSNRSSVEYFQFIKPIKSNQDPTSQRSKLIKLNENQRIQYNGSSASSFSSSSVSSASSSSKTNKKYSTSSLNLDQLSTHRKSSSFDSLIENVIQNKQRALGSLSSIHFNSLLEMTNGKLVENFVDSKQETDYNPNSVDGSGDGVVSSGGGGYQMNDLFYQIALQKTNNYRTAAVMKPVVNQVVKIAKPKPKAKTLSTLAIIREETMNSKTKTGKKSKTTRKVFNSNYALPSNNARANIVKLKT